MTKKERNQLETMWGSDIYRVIRQTLKENGYKNTEYYYDIMFVKTKSIKKAEKRNIINGNVRDDYDKNI